MFKRLVHADWGVDQRKRHLAEARRESDRWQVVDLRRVGPSAAFVDQIFDGTSTLVGFDFPIGLPLAYGSRTGLLGFTDALKRFGEDRWLKVFDVVDDKAEIAIERPFYPMRSIKGVTRTALVNGLGVERFDDLLRRCERRTDKRNAACSVFWTLGGNQVGKGAISGWREIIKPGLARGAGLWPFDGSIAALADRSTVVLAETYPAAAYEASGITFSGGKGGGKKSQSARRANARAISAHAKQHDILMSEAVEAMVNDGFGPSSSGEDAFDALAGLLLMIEIVEGRRDEAPTRGEAAEVWEGWILGV